MSSLAHSVIRYYNKNAMIWEASLTTYQTTMSSHSKYPTCPLIRDGFRMTSFIMSLLLAFRLNRGYERFKDARGGISSIVRKYEIYVSMS